MKILAVLFLLCASIVIASARVTLQHQNSLEQIPTITSRAPQQPQPQPLVEDSLCKAIGGRCFDTHDFTCSTGFISNMCGTNAAQFIQCCRQRPPIPPEFQETGGVPANGRPTFNQLVKCYPQGAAADVKKQIGGYVNADWIENTCAIRMSHTLNCLNNPKTKIPYIKGQSVTGANRNHNYIFRVKKLSPVIEGMFGKPQVFTAPTGRGVPVLTFPKDRGIIYFDTEGAWSNASGHFDLWDGFAMIEKGHSDFNTTLRYFSLSRSIYLWKF